MNEQRQGKVIAIVGSYRKLGVVDTAVDEVLSEIQMHGLVTEKIYLLDRHIEFCSNCRTCMQAAGDARGCGVIDDDMDGILDNNERADCLIIGAPVNMDNVNTLTGTFIERCAGYGCWSWGEPIPKIKSEA